MFPNQGPEFQVIWEKTKASTDGSICPNQMDGKPEGDFSRGFQVLGGTAFL